MVDAAADIQNKDLIYYKRFEAALRAQLKPLVTPELIEEHRQKPIGQHSDSLERVLNYFRRAPAEGKYALFELEPNRKYKVIVTTGWRDELPADADGKIYTDKNEALHAIFLKRVEELTEN